MAHRPEMVEEQQKTSEMTLHLVDVEPVAGLVAATARFCTSLSPEVYAAMSPDATEALGTVQSILWRLEHSHPEKV